MRNIFLKASLITCLVLFSACSSSEASVNLAKTEEKLAALESRVLNLESNNEVEDLAENIELLKQDILTLEVNLAVEETTNYFYEFVPELCSKASVHWEKRKKSFQLFRMRCNGDQECQKYIDTMVSSLQGELEDSCN